MSSKGSTLGSRLREWRTGMGMTLAAVSEQTGVASSTLSKIENEQVSVSYYTLKKICDGLDIPIEQIINPTHKSFASGRRSFTRKDESSVFRCPQYIYEAHSTEISRKEMIPLVMTILAKDKSDFDEWSKHDGEEFIYVLEGEIEVYTEFYTPLTLKQGDSLYFDSNMGHMYVSKSETPARLISICYDPKAARMQHMSEFFAAGTLDVVADESNNKKRR